jgi:hypothetical protein
LDLCKRILDERPNFKTDVLWEKWGTLEIQQQFKMSKSKASKHFRWLYVYLKDRTELVNRVINERGKNRTEV